MPPATRARVPPVLGILLGRGTGPCALASSDVLYENALRAVIDEVKERAVATGRSLLVGEPERLGNAGYSCEPLVRCKVRTFPDVDSPTTSACVYRLA